MYTLQRQISIFKCVSINDKKKFFGYQLFHYENKLSNIHKVPVSITKIFQVY